MSRRESITISTRERKHYDRLLRATAHIAPYMRCTSQELQYRDAITVVKAYRKGELELLDGDTITRLARGLYGRRGRAYAVAPR